MYTVAQYTVFMQGFTKEVWHKYTHNNDSPATAGGVTILREQEGTQEIKAGTRLMEEKEGEDLLEIVDVESVRQKNVTYSS